MQQIYSDGSTITTSAYLFGGLYEVTLETSAVRKYYSLAGQTVAMQDSAGLKYFLTDHLGSTLAVLDVVGAVLQQQRYLPFGQVRTISGSTSVTATDFGYTFQRSLPDMGLMDYRARFYSQSLGRFIQPDTIVPGGANPQAFNRYSYVYNDPVNAIDPSGHYGGRVHEQRRWFYEAYGSHWQEHFRAWRNRGVKPPTCAELGCGPRSDGDNGGGESGVSPFCSAIYCSGIPFTSGGNGSSLNAFGGSGNYGAGLLNWLSSVNWGAKTGPIRLFQAFGVGWSIKITGAYSVTYANGSSTTIFVWPPPGSTRQMFLQGNNGFSISGSETGFYGYTQSSPWGEALNDGLGSATGFDFNPFTRAVSTKTSVMDGPWTVTQSLTVDAKFDPVISGGFAAIGLAAAGAALFLTPWPDEEVAGGGLIFVTCRYVLKTC